MDEYNNQIKNSNTKENSSLKKAEDIANKNFGTSTVPTDNNIGSGKAYGIENVLDDIIPEEKTKNKKSRHEKKGKSIFAKRKGGLIVALVCTSFLSVVLSGILLFNFLAPESGRNSLESVYRRAFFDSADQIDNIDLNLSKILSTKDKSAIQPYLLDLAVNSELLESDLSGLPIEDQNKFYTTKVINQIGDYAKYLNKKLSRGENLDQKDKENLLALYKANKGVQEFFQEMFYNMKDDFSFSGSLKKGSKNFFTDGLTKLENLSNEYPELIYDGPFSDGLENREVKGLTGANITSSEAVDIFNKIFGGYGLTNVKNDGETSGIIECFNVSGMYEDQLVYAQISKKGGHLIMFEYAGSCNEINYNQEYAIKTAVEFLSSLNINGMKAVWVNLASNVYTVNLAYHIDDVPVYSDLIKVRICAETGKVLGLEASSYFINHTSRTLPKSTISKKQARECLSTDLIINSVRLALIPKGNNSEVLCYEFNGESNGSVFYVYINADTGSQEEMFKVIESTEGTLLM